MKHKKLTYLTLGRTITQPPLSSSVFVCGQRCTSEIDLTCNRVGRTATAPVDILTSLHFAIPNEHTEKTIHYPNHVEKEHQLTKTVKAKSFWFAPVDLPAVVVMWRFFNCGQDEIQVDVTCQAEFNLNYISKFRKYSNDIGLVKGKFITIADSRYPELQGMLTTSPMWSKCSLSTDESMSTDSVVIEQPSIVRASFTCPISISPGKESTFVVAVSGSNQYGITERTVCELIANPQVWFDQMLSHWKQLTENLSIYTPSLTLNELFSYSKLWPWMNTRVVPLGEPYVISQYCAELIALTASPDYHGLFANDNAQATWELGSLGKDFYSILCNTLEVLYRFGTPESVEIDPVDATGRPWISPLRIGEKAEWVMGACSLILWSGKYQSEMWLKIQEVLDRFYQDDRDGDWMDDWSCSSYPEQPDPGVFSHEMLYASAFWAKAFMMAMEVALLVECLEKAEKYKQTAQKITTALEKNFEAEFGYASWLSNNHTQHPHKGHNMVLPVHYGLASLENAVNVIHTLTSEPMMVKEGPLAAEPAYQILGGNHVWNFARWALVHGMYLYGKVEQATQLLLEWAEQEKDFGFQAPEGFPTVTGVTGKGYTWSAGAVIRAVLFGLFGIELVSAGLYIYPRLPEGWASMSLTGLSFRDAIYDLEVRQSDKNSLRIDDQEIQSDSRDPFFLIKAFSDGYHLIEIRIKQH